VRRGSASIALRCRSRARHRATRRNSKHFCLRLCSALEDEKQTCSNGKASILQPRQFGFSQRNGISSRPAKARLAAAGRARISCVIQGMACKGNRRIRDRIGTDRQRAFLISGIGCQETFDALLAWLRTKGVQGRKPFQQLRKLFGSAVTGTQGIHVASASLRHAVFRP
jgi:hypothetical protein